MQQPEPLTAGQERFWRAIARAMVALPRELDADLTRDAGMHLSEYAALMHLSETPGGAMRMSDLAGNLALSASRITRLVDGLAREGLVTRRACESDSRGQLAVLLDAGRERLARAWPAHLASVRHRMIDHTGDADLEEFAAVLERCLDAGT